MSLSEVLKNVSYNLNRKYILPLSLTLTVFAYTQNVYSQSLWERIKTEARETYEEQKERAKEEIEKQSEKVRETYREQKERAREGIERQSERAKETYHEQKERAREGIERQSERAKETYHEQKERAKEEIERQRERAREETGNFEGTPRSIIYQNRSDRERKRRAQDNLSRSDQTYRGTANNSEGIPTSVDVNELTRSVRGFASDPEYIRKTYEKYERASRGIKEIEISAIKIIPVYDPVTRKIQTLDTVVRRIVNETGGDTFKGTELGEDPVRVAFLMATDANYLLHAKTIRVDEGKWMSLNEALDQGFKPNLILPAFKEYNSLKLATKSGDTTQISQSLEGFSRSIDKINGSAPPLTLTERVSMRVNEFSAKSNPIVNETLSDIGYNLKMSYKDIGTLVRYFPPAIPLFLTMSLFLLIHLFNRKRAPNDTDQTPKKLQTLEEQITPTNPLNIPKLTNIPNPPEDPSHILKLRLVKGEISTKEFERIMKSLKKYD